VNPKFYRPVENEDLVGSYAKAKKTLGWEPKYTLESLVEEMVLSDLELVKNGKIFSNTNLDWLVDELENTEDKGITNGNGRVSPGTCNGNCSLTQNGNGLEHVVDSGITNGNGVSPAIFNGNGSVAPVSNGLEHIAEDKPLSKGETNGHSLSPPPVTV
jgi:hypothetical protein